ncbi:hypothetical protein [Kitasatospora sp. NPDC094015]|uniref:hypothetical protein n=1 Tax=Kitasatospora sp. NPDC094015 TaxID=3155205 RepID=UPI0033260DE7
MPFEQPAEPVEPGLRQRQRAAGEEVVLGTIARRTPPGIADAGAERPIRRTHDGRPNTSSTMAHCRPPDRGAAGISVPESSPIEIVP